MKKELSFYCTKLFEWRYRMKGLLKGYYETLIPFIILIILWTGCTIFFRSDIVMILLKVVVWSGIVFVFSKFIFKNSFSLKNEFKRPDKNAWLKFGAGIILLALVLVVAGYRTTGSLPDFDIKRLELWEVIGTVITAPVIEEIYFRGFMRHSQIRDGHKSSILNCLAFVLIHYPKYFCSGTGALEIISSSITLGMLAYLFLLIRNETENLMFPIMMHAFWNFGTLLIL